MVMTEIAVPAGIVAVLPPRTIAPGDAAGNGAADAAAGAVERMFGSNTRRSTARGFAVPAGAAGAPGC
jgi:hypothetical protein